MQTVKVEWAMALSTVLATCCITCVYFRDLK